MSYYCNDLILYEFLIDRLDRQSQCTTFERGRDATITSKSTNGKKRAVIFEAMTLTAQMIQSVTSIFQLLAAPLIFIYEDRENSSSAPTDRYEIKTRIYTPIPPSSWVH